ARRARLLLSLDPSRRSDGSVAGARRRARGRRSRGPRGRNDHVRARASAGRRGRGPGASPAVTGVADQPRASAEIERSVVLLKRAHPGPGGPDRPRRTLILWYHWPHEVM